MKNNPVPDPAKDPFRCKCQNAVRRAYGALISSGQPRETALYAAKTIYRHHHPEDSKADSALIVERWVNQGQFH